MAEARINQLSSENLKRNFLFMSRKKIQRNQKKSTVASGYLHRQQKVKTERILVEIGTRSVVMIISALISPTQVIVTKKFYITLFFFYS